MNVTIENSLDVYNEFKRCNKITFRLASFLALMLFGGIGSLFVIDKINGWIALSHILSMGIVFAYAQIKEHQADKLFKNLVGLKGITVKNQTYIFENHNYNLFNHKQQGDKIVITLEKTGFINEPLAQDSVNLLIKNNNKKLIWIGVSMLPIMVSAIILKESFPQLYIQYLLSLQILGSVLVLFMMWLLFGGGNKERQLIEQHGFKHIKNSFYEKDGKTYEVVVDQLFSYKELGLKNIEI